MNVNQIIASIPSSGERFYVYGADRVILVREDAQAGLHTTTSLDFVLYLLHILHDNKASIFEASHTDIYEYKYQIPDTTR